MLMTPSEWAELETEARNEAVDLFEYIDQCPNSKLTKICSDMLDSATNGEHLQAQDVESYQQEMERIGYTFDYDFLCVPFNLRPL